MISRSMISPDGNVRPCAHRPFALLILSTMVFLWPVSAAADSLVMVLGDVLSRRTAEIAATLDAAPAGGTATHVTDPVTDPAVFLESVSRLGDGDVLYLNTHSNTECVALGETRLTFDAVAAALRRDAQGNPRTPPRLLAVVIDGCMEGGTREDFANVSEAFNAELVLGWSSWANSITHDSCMYAILHHIFVDGGLLAEVPYDKTPAMCGRSYLYAPYNYYGRTIDEVLAHIRERLAGGAPPDMAGDEYDPDYCARIFAENPVLCTFQSMHSESDGTENLSDRVRCCQPTP